MSPEYDCRIPGSFDSPAIPVVSRSSSREANVVLVEGVYLRPIDDPHVEPLFPAIAEPWLVSTPLLIWRAPVVHVTHESEFWFGLAMLVSLVICNGNS
jgi:hypothetical protein